MGERKRTQDNQLDCDSLADRIRHKTCQYSKQGLKTLVSYEFQSS